MSTLSQSEFETIKQFLLTENYYCTVEDENRRRIVIECDATEDNENET